MKNNALVDAPNLRKLTETYDDALALITSLPPSRQRALAISALEESFFHACLSDAGVDSPIRMK